MHSLFRKFWLLPAALLLCASASFAQTTTMTLTGTGDNAVVWGNAGGVYVDPYTATVTGIGSTSVICDDWSDNSYVGTTWTASVTQVTGLSNSLTNPTNPPLFNPTGSGISQQTLYAEVAWLAAQLMANPTNPANQTEYSFAIWELTFPYNTNSDGTNPTSFLASSSGGSAIQALVTQAIANAQSAVAGGYTGQGWEILTPSPESSTEPQEFLVLTPESSTIAMLGADLLGILALGFFFRRRVVQPVS